MRLFKEPKIQFLKYKYFAFLLSGFIITSGIVSIVQKKGLNFGVDFAGGTLIRIKFEQPTPIDKIRGALKNVGLGQSRIQEVGHEKKEYLIRTITLKEKEELEAHEIMGRKIVDALKKHEELGRFEILSKETVGPAVGHDLRKKATQATIWALIGMLIYIALRFQISYGIAAILTLTHDVLITTSILSLTNREINLPVIAAILTIVGYSLNDTIVIFDRVRDNLKISRKRSFEEILNDSINQTLSRTIVTSFTTLLTVLALYFLGGEVINDFAFTMMVGVISGTYSTIYQSCPVVLAWHNIFKKRKK
jgi:preprotein translocase SecF subunit